MLVKDIGENKTERININPSSDISQETIEMDNFIDKLSVIWDINSLEIDIKIQKCKVSERKSI